MWQYDQSSGELTRGGAVVSRGYSGKGRGKNNPSLQAVKAVGPIPRGRWKITSVENGGHTGPFTIILDPEPGTDTEGRSLFRIHGDSISDPGNASLGCIILPRDVRQKIWGSGDRELQVVA